MRLLFVVENVCYAISNMMVNNRAALESVVAAGLLATFVHLLELYRHADRAYRHAPPRPPLPAAARAHQGAGGGGGIDDVGSRDGVREAEAEAEAEAEEEVRVEAEAALHDSLGDMVGGVVAVLHGITVHQDEHTDEIATESVLKMVNSVLVHAPEPVRERCIIGFLFNVSVKGTAGFVKGDMGNIYYNRFAGADIVGTLFSLAQGSFGTRFPNGRNFCYLTLANIHRNKKLTPAHRAIIDPLKKLRKDGVPSVRLKAQEALESLKENRGNYADIGE